MPVLAGVERELIPGQLASLPAEVERVAEDVPTLASRVHLVEQIHLTPFAATPHVDPIDRGGTPGTLFRRCRGWTSIQGPSRPRSPRRRSRSCASSTARAGSCPSTRPASGRPASPPTT